MDKTITVYGIANCDTVKRARAWLDGRGVVYRFHDFRKEGLPLANVDRWLAAAGWETLLNRKGTPHHCNLKEARQRRQSPSTRSGIRLPSTTTTEVLNTLKSIPSLQSNSRNPALDLNRSRSPKYALKKASAQYRSDIAALKREVTALRQQLGRLSKVQGKRSQPIAVDEPKSSLRFGAKGFAAQRQRLGLSANALATLLGVSGSRFTSGRTARHVLAQVNCRRLPP